MSIEREQPYLVGEGEEFPFRVVDAAGRFDVVFGTDRGAG
jgi:hypothetical protein